MEFLNDRPKVLRWHGKDNEMRGLNSLKKICGNPDGFRNANAGKELAVFSSLLERLHVLRKRPPPPHAVSSAMQMDG